MGQAKHVTPIAIKKDQIQMPAEGLLYKWIIINSSEFYQTGQIINVVSDHLVLIKMRPTNDSPPSQCVRDINHFDCDGCERSTLLFDNEEELDAWIKWFDTPDPPAVTSPSKVVPISKRKH